MTNKTAIKNKESKVYRSIRLDSDIYDAIKEVEAAEDRNFSNALSRLLKIGIKQWKRNASKNVACM